MICKTTIEHKGYTASIEWDEECNCYSGIVLGSAVNSIVFRISVIYPDVRQKEITWQENTDDTTYPTDSGN